VPALLPNQNLHKKIQRQKQILQHTINIKVQQKQKVTLQTHKQINQNVTQQGIAQVAGWDKLMEDGKRKMYPFYILSITFYINKKYYETISNCFNSHDQL